MRMKGQLNVSTPAEYQSKLHLPQLFGTRRVGPDLSREAGLGVIRRVETGRNRVVFGPGSRAELAAIISDFASRHPGVGRSRHYLWRCRPLGGRGHRTVAVQHRAKGSLPGKAHTRLPKN